MQGEEWSQDRNVSQGLVGEVTGTVVGGDDPVVYSTYREGSCAYRFPLANGRYRVELLFVEPKATRPQERLFNVNAQRQRVIRGLDLFHEVGRLAAYKRSFDVEVKDGVLDLELVSVVGEAIVSGLVATRESPSP